MNDAQAIKWCANDLKLFSPSFNITMGSPDTSLSANRGLTFDPEILATALLGGCTPQAIRSYIKSYHRNSVQAKVESLVKDRKLLSYAVKANSPEFVQLLLEYGASANSMDSSKIPLLARAIMQFRWTVQDSTELVKVLLAYGADPQVILKDMWKDFIRQPAANTSMSDKAGNEAAAWCKPGHRVVLAGTLHLTHRYLLWRADLEGKVWARKRQVAVHHNIKPLFGLPFMVVGQHHACKLVMDTVFSEIVFPSDKPLVLAFAGLSGHGKTELAKQLGSLINGPSVEIDCAQISTEFGLLGTTAGYESNLQGSELNNFLADNGSRRCVVFLDEFDKTTKGVREALLKVTDTGMYHDRRPNGSDVDASRCIWISASNLGDDTIEQFHTDHFAKLKEEDVSKVSIEPLREQLQRVFRKAYSPAVTGRVGTIVPFFPFSPNEQAVVAHKFLIALQREAREPIDLDHVPPKFVGHCHIDIKEDGALCRSLVKTGYTTKQGARSISNAVDKIRRKFLNEYMDTDVPVLDRVNMGPLHKYDVELHPDGGSSEITVYRHGTTSLKGVEEV